MNLHRQLLDWEWFDNSHMVHIWVYFLLKANYQDSKWHGIDIPRGSFITSLDTISKDTKLTIREVRTCIGKLKKTGEVTITATNRYSIVTICNYDTYNPTGDVCDRQSDKQKTGKRHSKSIQKTIDKEGNIFNKEIEEKKDNCDADASLSVCTDDISAFDYDGFVKYFNSTLDKNGSIIPRIKVFDDRRKSVIHARLVQFGKDALYEAVEKAAKSFFLNGGGSKGWKAKFDWIFGPDNFKKVLEGNYDNDRKMGMEVGVNYQGNNTGKFDNMDLWK